jgi:hypothetical protein
MEDRPAQFLEPGKRGGFDGGFGKRVHYDSLTKARGIPPSELTGTRIPFLSCFMTNSAQLAITLFLLHDIGLSCNKNLSFYGLSFIMK